MIKVMAVCAYPKEFACTRYRLVQYIEPLRSYGIDLDVRPFFTSIEYARFYDRTAIASRLLTIAAPVARRMFDISRAMRSDVLIVQREAMPFGPAIFEWLYQKFGRLPMIVDLDDAVHIPYLSPRYGRAGSILKFFGKTMRLVKTSDTVICGGGYLAKTIAEEGIGTEVIPTVADPRVFLPGIRDNIPLVIGWIGTPSAFPFLAWTFPVLQRLAEKYDFILKVRGSGKDELFIPGVRVDNAPWELDSELEDFRSFDIGLYPLVPGEGASAEWIKGKSGFKAIQYMTLGLPFVMTPIGVTEMLGVPGETHFEASSPKEWETAIAMLLADADLRKNMGDAGRAFALKEFDLETQTRKLVEIIRELAK